MCTYVFIHLIVMRLGWRARPLHQLLSLLLPLLLLLLLLRLYVLPSSGPAPPQLAIVERNLSVVLADLPGFRYLETSHACPASTDLAIIAITVLSAPGHTAARAAIRASWARQSTTAPATSHTVFLLGRPRQEWQQQQLEREAAKYGDIVQGDFIDSYQNLTYKTLMGLHWVSVFCSQAEYAVKTDDDMFLDVFELFMVARATDADLVCPVFNKSPIMLAGTGRERQGGLGRKGMMDKWVVEEKELPGPQRDFYPPYCVGNLYLTRPSTAARLVLAAAGSFFRMEDVWVTGYLASSLGLTKFNIQHLWTRSLHQLLVTKVAQSPVVYQPDLVVGPMQGRLELGLTLAKRAEQCWLKQCYNNVYHDPPSHPAALLDTRTIGKYCRLPDIQLSDNDNGVTPKLPIFVLADRKRKKGLS